MADDDNVPKRDLDDGLRFVHALTMQTKFDVNETTTRLLALLEELIARGQIDLRTYEERRERIRARHNQGDQKVHLVQVSPTIDKYKMTELPEIDCIDRLPICEARCCKLTFPLSFQDLDEGVVKWEYGRPYLIRHGADGYCVHYQQGKGCGCYEHRPAICRSYDCRKDKRIWSDFDNKVMAPWPNRNPSPTAREVHGDRMASPDPDGPLDPNRPPGEAG